MSRIVPTAIALVLLGACGGVDDGAPSSPESSSSAVASDAPATSTVAAPPPTEAAAAARFTLEPVAAEQWSEGPFMVAVVAAGPGYVAAGRSGYELGAEAVVWTSPDAQTWQRVPHDPAVFGDASENDTATSAQVIADLAAG